MRLINIGFAKSYAYSELSVEQSKKAQIRLIRRAFCLACIALVFSCGSAVALDVPADDGGGGGGFGNFGDLGGGVNWNAPFSGFGDNSAPNTLPPVNVWAVYNPGPTEQFNTPPPSRGSDVGYIPRIQLTNNKANTTNLKHDKNQLCHAGDPVVIGTGAKIEAVTEFALPGEMGLTFARYYNSQYFSGDGTAALGTWTTSIDYHLSYTYCSNVTGGTSPCAPLRFSEPDGSQLYFTQNPDPNTNSNNTQFQLTGPFVETDANRNPNGGSASLTYANGTYTLHNEDSRVLTFASSGVVLSIKDVSGIGWALTHPNSTDTLVTHTSGQSYTVHNTLPQWGKGSGTVTVTDPAGNVYSYQSETTLASAAAFSSIGLISSATTPSSNSSTSDTTTTAYKYINPSLPVTSANVGARYSDELSEVDYNNVEHDVTSYDSVGRVLQTINGDGTEKTTFTYGSTSTGPTTTLTNALGHTVIFQYNGDAEVVSTTGNASATCPAYFSSRKYDANGNLSSSTDNNGNTTGMTYASSGKLMQKVEAAGSTVARTTDYNWDTTPGADRLLSITVEGLSKMTFTYDAQGRRTSTTTTNLALIGTANQTQQTTIAYALSSNGMVTVKTITPPLSTNTLTYDYDANGNLTSITNALGQAVKYGNYSALGDARAITQPNGYGQFLSYDARGRLTGTVTSHANSAVYNTVAYDPNSGLVSDIYKSDQEHIHNAYDADFKLTSATWAGPSGAVITTKNTYNTLGNVTGISTALNGSSTPAVSKYWDYDELGRAIATRGNNGQKTSVTYDLNGNIATSTDSAGHATKRTYDALNRLTSTTTANGGITASLYGSDDHVVKVTDPRGLATSYAYDGFGQLWTLTSPDTGTTNYVYNAFGQRTSATPNSGTAITFAYDLINRVTSVAAGGEKHTYTYDNCTNGLGQLCADSTPSTGNSYTFTPEGWKAQKTVNTILGPQVESYAYDFMGRITQIVNGPITLAYQWTDDQVSDVSATIGGTTQEVASKITYDASRHVTGWLYGNGMGRSQTYDSDGRITALSSSTSNTALQALGFSYNNINEMTSLANTANSSASQNFTYNAIDRLTGMTGRAALTLTYDPNGNRTSQTGDGTVKVSTTSNQILSQGLHTYAYDANGSRTMDAVSGSTLNYTYDGFGRMRTASRDNAATICETNGTCPAYPSGTMTYVVDPEGMREAKTNPNGETVWYDYLPSGQLNSELSSTRGNNYYVYLGGQPVGVIHNPETGSKVNTLYFVHADQMGRPEVITDSAQNIAWKGVNYAFDSAVLSTGAVTGIDIGLPGQINDAETGNWSNGYRDYGSSDGRYLESDSIGLGGGINTYAYVGNNPLSYSDPFGLEQGQAFNAIFRMSGGVANNAPIQADYIHLSAGVYIVTISATLTKNGTLFLGYGAAHTDPWSLMSGKAGISLTAGKMTGCPKTGDQVDNFITGASTGVSAFYGVGGGYSMNAAGSAFEGGLGTPGGSLQAVEYMTPVLSTGASW